MITPVVEKALIDLGSLSVPGPQISCPGHVPAHGTEAARPRVHAEVGRYRLRLAESVEDRDAACRLRFRVFNIELGEGLDSS